MLKTLESIESITRPAKSEVGVDIDNSGDGGDGVDDSSYDNKHSS